MASRSIDALHRSKTGKVSDKWASYLTYYDALFAPLREAPISMLEIGIQNGGSLETWASYFTQARQFIGCDIDPRCEALRYEDPRVSVVVGDANSAPAYQKSPAPRSGPPPRGRGRPGSTSPGGRRPWRRGPDRPIAPSPPPPACR